MLRHYGTGPALNVPPEDPTGTAVPDRALRRLPFRRVGAGSAVPALVFVSTPITARGRRLD